MDIVERLIADHESIFGSLPHSHYKEAADEIAKLRAELEVERFNLAKMRELRAEVERLTTFETVLSQNGDITAQTINKLRAELAEAKKDAARYQWLIQHGEANSKQSTRSRIYRDELRRMVLVDFAYWCSAEEVSTAIDKAMRTTEESPVAGKGNLCTKK